MSNIQWSSTNVWVKSTRRLPVTMQDAATMTANGEESTSPSPPPDSLGNENDNDDDDSPADAPDSSMAANTQKRWLTQPKSKIANADLSAILHKGESWSLVPVETRQSLYDMLPPPLEGEPAHNVDVHPLQTSLKQYIEEGIRTWQQDLKDGKEVKKWRDDAMQANKDREDGKWDEFKDYQREQDWAFDDEDDESGDGNKRKATDDLNADEGDEQSEGSEIVVNKPKSKIVKKAKAIRNETSENEATASETVKAKTAKADADEDEKDELEF